MSSQDRASPDLWVSALRMPDQLNPVMLRETQSLYKGRVFPIFLILVLACMVLTSGIFLFQFSPRGATGLEFLQVTISFLAPILLVLIPLQAGQSMTQELKDGSGSVLLMSGLSPQRIVAGKIQAGLLQMAVALGLFSPLIAVSYLLRGTDALLILGIIIASVFANLLATTMAVAVSAQLAALKRPIIAALIIVLGLGLGTLSFLIQFEEIIVYAPVWTGMILTPTGLTILTCSYLACLVLAWLIATAALTHPNENRATAFRIYHSTVLLLIPALVFLLTPTKDWLTGLVSWGMTGAVISIPFFFSACTDAPGLSPRVRAHVPQRFPSFSVLFLPGCGRGLVYALSWSLVLWGTATLASSGTHYLHRQLLPYVTGILLYTLLYSAASCTVRSRLPLHISRNWITRLLTLFLLLLLCFVPFLIQAPFGSMEWNILHIGNPFFTIAYVGERNAYFAFVLVALAIVLLTFTNRRLLRSSWTEVRESASAKGSRS